MCPTGHLKSCPDHISETTGPIFMIARPLESSRAVDVHWLGHFSEAHNTVPEIGSMGSCTIKLQVTHSQWNSVGGSVDPSRIKMMKVSPGHYTEPLRWVPKDWKNMLSGTWPPVGPTSRFRRRSALGHYLVRNLKPWWSKMICESLSLLMGYAPCYNTILVNFLLELF